MGAGGVPEGSGTGGVPPPPPFGQTPAAAVPPPYTPPTGDPVATPPPYAPPQQVVVPAQTQWGQQQLGQPFPTHVVGHTDEAPSYGRFMDRLGGLIMDGLILVAAFALFFAMFWLLMVGLASVGAGCAAPGGSIYAARSCDNFYRWVAVFLFVVLVGGLFLTWWKIIPARMSNYGGTPGMRAARLEIRQLDADGVPGPHVSQGRAFLRAVLALLLPYALTMALSGLLIRDGASRGLVAAATGLASLLYLLPWLWAIFDPKRQTLYDKITRTVVVGRLGRPEPCSQFALGFALILLWPIAIVLGHIGLRRTSQLGQERPGRGAALAALWLGYLGLVQTVLLVVALIVSGGSLSDLWERAERTTSGSDTQRVTSGSDTQTVTVCRIQREIIQEAVERFERGHGRLPVSEEELVAAGDLKRESSWFDVVSGLGGVAVVVAPGGYCDGVIEDE